MQVIRTIGVFCEKCGEELVEMESGIADEFMGRYIRWVECPKCPVDKFKGFRMEA